MWLNCLQTERGFDIVEKGVASVSERDENLSDFIACIPQEIQADWDPKYAPLLAGFPLNLMFIRIRKPKNGEEPPQIVSSVYQFDLSTFRQDPDKREMI